MSRNNEKIKAFHNPRTGETIRSVTSPNGMMVTWQRKEVRYISGENIMGNMETVLDTFNEAYRGMSDEYFYGYYGCEEHEEEKSFRIEVTGWVDITFEEAEKFISDPDRTISETEAADREAARQQIERLRLQFPGL